MNLSNWLKNKLNFLPIRNNNDIPISAIDLINFKIVIVEFSDNVEGRSGEIITQLLNQKEGINVSYYDDPFPKNFLSLESRTIFDLIDRGQTLLDKTQADVLVWGYRDGDKIRLNFQTEQQYEELHNFVREAKFDRLGCFTYSAEEGTIAAEMPDQVDQQVKQDRAEHIMETQLDIASAKNEAKIGTVQRVLIEGWDDYIKCYYGRSAADAPEIDGKVFFMAKEQLLIGDFADVQINDILEYDLLGEQI